MPIPYTFEPGTIAASSEVNANFQWIEAIIGVNSTGTRMQLGGDMGFGPRDNIQLTAESDTAANTNNSYLHLGYNAELYKSGASWKYRRFHTGEIAHAMRMGKAGISFYSTSRKDGDLNSQLTLMFNIGSTMSNNDRDWVFVRDSFTNVNQSPTSPEHVRTTLVFFETPKTVYENANISGSSERNATSYGVPASATAVLLSFEGKASSSDSSVLFTRAASTRHQKNGFRVSQKANVIAAGQGLVTLGISGSYLNKFVQVCDHSWTSASLYIQGYCI